VLSQAGMVIPACLVILVVRTFISDQCFGLTGRPMGTAEEHSSRQWLESHFIHQPCLQHTPFLVLSRNFKSFMKIKSWLLCS
jgi:hypothetical protein